MMWPRAYLRFVLAVGLLCGCAGGWNSAGAAGSPDGIEFFEKRIRPILAGHCYECHSAAGKKTKGGLGLDTRDGLRKGGDSGPALVPGTPEKSLLIRAV